MPARDVLCGLLLATGATSWPINGSSGGAGSRPGSGTTIPRDGPYAIAKCWLARTRCACRRPGATCTCGKPARGDPAWGFDVKGRKQYRYHARAVAQREQRKYYRLRRLARDLPMIRDALYTQLGSSRELTRDRVAAGVLRLISKGFFRPGNERYTRENHTFGITTLNKRHVRVDGDAIAFAFRGKSNKEQRRVVVDRALAKLVQALLRTPGARLFRYTSGDAWHNLTQRDVNDYVRRLVPARYTAKDFRTWGGTLAWRWSCRTWGRPPASARRRRTSCWPCGWWRQSWATRRPFAARATYIRSSSRGISITEKPSCLARRPRAWAATIRKSGR